MFGNNKTVFLLFFKRLLLIITFGFMGVKCFVTFVNANNKQQQQK